MFDRDQEGPIGKSSRCFIDCHSYDASEKGYWYVGLVYESLGWSYSCYSFLFLFFIFLLEPFTWHIILESTFVCTLKSFRILHLRWSAVPVRGRRSYLPPTWACLFGQLILTCYMHLCNRKAIVYWHRNSQYMKHFISLVGLGGSIVGWFFAYLDGIGITFKVSYS